MRATRSDAELGAHVRQQNRIRAERLRERLVESGRTPTTLWLSVQTKAVLTELARQSKETQSDIAERILSAALNEPATPVQSTNTRRESDTTVDWISDLTPADINSVAECAPGTPEPASPEPESATPPPVSVESERDAIMVEIGAMLNEGLSGGEIARRLNASGKRTATGKEFQGGNIKRDYRKWQATLGNVINHA